MPDTKLEVVIIPVSDVDRDKGFYESLGWHLDGDFRAGDDWRGLQMTLPGSPCSIVFGMVTTTCRCETLASTSFCSHSAHKSCFLFSHEAKRFPCW